jgi:hypothetical protein
MAYTNVPPSMQDIHALINDRLSKVENAGRFTAPVLQDPFLSYSNWLKSRPQTGDVFVDQETSAGYEWTTALSYQKPVTYPSGYIADIPFADATFAQFNITTAEGYWNFKAGTVFTVSGATVTSFSTYAEKEFYNTVWVVSGPPTSLYTPIDAVKIADQPPLATSPTYTASSGTYTIISEPAFLAEQNQKSIFTTNTFFAVYPNKPVYVYHPSNDVSVAIESYPGMTGTFTVYVESGAVGRRITNVSGINSPTIKWSPSFNPNISAPYTTLGYHFQPIRAIDETTNIEYEYIYVTWEKYA